MSPSSTATPAPHPAGDHRRHQPAGLDRGHQLDALPSNGPYPRQAGQLGQVPHCRWTIRLGARPLPGIGEGLPAAGRRRSAPGGGTEYFTVFDTSLARSSASPYRCYGPGWRRAYHDQPTGQRRLERADRGAGRRLELDHDQSCTDTSRLFYLPRRPPWTPARNCDAEGVPCDIFALPSEGRERSGRRKDAAAAQRSRARIPRPGYRRDLRSAGLGPEHGHRFEIAKALRARRPGVFVGKVADGAKHHIRCVNEDQHRGRRRRGDLGRGCQREREPGLRLSLPACPLRRRDRLFFLRKMLEQRWLSR